MLKQNSKTLAGLFILLLLYLPSFKSYAETVKYGEELINSEVQKMSVAFIDVPESHWAYKYVAEMVKRKIVSGYPDGLFRPDRTISRAEFAKILVSASGLKACKVNYSTFSDVKATEWHSPFIEAVKEYLTGYRMANGQSNYSPDMPALREDIAVAIVKLKGYDIRLADRSILEAMFVDYESISESAKDYIAIAVENNIISGFTNSTFRGQETITRAQASAILWRAFMYGNDNKSVVGEGKIKEPVVTSPATIIKTQDDVSTTPTIDVVPTPIITPSATPIPKIVAEKFTVDTLAGGIGSGDADGSVTKARINGVDSMVIDKDDNLYFLDKANKRIRKFNPKNGTIETVINIDRRFDVTIGKDGKDTRYNSSEFIPDKLAYNRATDKLYLSGSYSTPTNLIIFEILPSISYEAFIDKGYPVRDADIIAFPDSTSMLFTSCSVYAFSVSNNFVNLYNFDTRTVETISSGEERTGFSLINTCYNSYKLEFISTVSSYYFLDYGNNKFWRMQLFPRKVDLIKSISNQTFNAACVYNNKFYISSGCSIYSMDLEGNIELFLDGKDLKYNDGNPIKWFKYFFFDSMGNIIMYDSSNYAIRRINL